MSEELVIRHCSPTLAGLKTGSLFSCPCRGWEQLTPAIRSLNHKLVPRGLRVLPLRLRGGPAHLRALRALHPPLPGPLGPGKAHRGPHGGRLKLPSLPLARPACQRRSGATRKNETGRRRIKSAPPSACRKSLFDRLLHFLTLLNGFKKWFDQTRKTTLTVFFHTIFPSEPFGQEGLSTVSGRRRIKSAPPCTVFVFI